MTEVERLVATHEISQLKEKWSRFFEQFPAIYKWVPGGLRQVQSCPRRRAALATDRPPRWATRGTPRISCYAASTSLAAKAR